MTRPTDWRPPTIRQCERTNVHGRHYWTDHADLGPAFNHDCPGVVDAGPVDSHPLEVTGGMVLCALRGCWCGQDYPQVMIIDGAFDVVTITRLHDLVAAHRAGQPTSEETPR